MLPWYYYCQIWQNNFIFSIPAHVQQNEMGTVWPILFYSKDVFFNIVH